VSVRVCTQAMMAKILATFDVNNNRTLEFAELRSMLVALNKGKPVGDWEVRAVLKAADKDRTGDISLDEMKGVRSLPCPSSCIHATPRVQLECELSSRIYCRAARNRPSQPGTG
jgi:hypothetical protein